MKGQDIKYVGLKSQAEAKVCCFLFIAPFFLPSYTTNAHRSIFPNMYTPDARVRFVQKLERLRRSLHFIGAPQQSKHTIFLDEDEAPTFSPQQHFDTPAELLTRAYNRPRNAQLDSSALASSADAQLPDSRKMERYLLLQALLHRSFQKTFCLMLPLS